MKDHSTLVDLFLCQALVDVPGTRIKRGAEHVYYLNKGMYHVITGQLRVVIFSPREMLLHFTDAEGYNTLAKLRQQMDVPKILGLEAVMSGVQS